MSDEIASVADITAFLETDGASGGGTSTGDTGGETAPDLNPGGAPGAADASGGGTTTGDDRSPFIPRDRFDQVNTQKNALEQQLQQLTPYQAVVQRFTELGYSPEAIAAQLDAIQNGQHQDPGAGYTAPEAPADPVEAFHTWLQDQGLDPYEMEPSQYGLAEVTFQQAQAIQQFQERAQQAEQAAAVAQLQNELAAVTTALPAFADPNLRQALLATYASAPETQSLRQVADSLWRGIETTNRNALAAAAAQQQQDGQRPNLGGGAPPSPATMPDWANLPDEELERNVAAFIAAQNRGG